MSAQTSLTFAARLRHLQQSLKPHQVVLITQHADVQYFTGFLTLLPEEHEAYLLVTTTESRLLHAAFSPYSLPPDLNQVLQVKASSSLTALTTALTSLKNISELLVDENSMTVKEFKSLPSTLESLPLSRTLIWELRQVKDSVEQQLLRQAGQVAIDSFQEVVGEHGEQLPPNITERQLAHQLETTMRQKGASGPSFPTIVAFGAAGALPHHQPSGQVLTPETPVLIDMGAKYQGYCSDMTRSFWYGSQPSPEFSTISTTVHNAYQAAVSAATDSQALAAEIDTAARKVIEAAGYGDQFIHTTGHGVGLEIHEPPSLNHQNSAPLQPGMAITVEPGIYLPGKFGYRYENTLLLTHSSPECLTQNSSQ